MEKKNLIKAALFAVAMSAALSTTPAIVCADSGDEGLPQPIPIVFEPEPETPGPKIQPCKEECYNYCDPDIIYRDGYVSVTNNCYEKCELICS